MQQQSEKVEQVELPETGEDVLSRVPKWPAPDFRAPIPAHLELPFIGEYYKFRGDLRNGGREYPRDINLSPL